ncbi:MAG: hypothetical protein IJQ99_07190 [Synergistaceae bacterium]|nr:hypothetical protein [Synergistaceae bacterium]
MIFRVLLESEKLSKNEHEMLSKVFVGGEFLVIETSEFLTTKSCSRNPQRAINKLSDSWQSYL